MKTNKINVKSAKRTICKLIDLEFRLGSPDAREVIRNERMALQGAIHRTDAAQDHIDAVEAEAIRVAEIWGQYR